MPDKSVDSESPDRKQVTLLLNSSAKDRWDRYLDESPSYNSRAELIRHAVEKEISDNEGEGSDPEAMSEIKDGLRQLENQVADLQRTVDAIAERTKETPESVKELGHEIFPHLPTRDEMMEYQQVVAQAGDGIGGAHVGPDRTNSGRVAALAEHVDADEADVRAALLQLQEDTYRVHSMDVNGETRFYKEV